MIRATCHDYINHVNMKEDFDYIEVISSLSNGKLMGFNMMHGAASVGITMTYAEMVELRDNINEAIGKRDASIHRP